MNEPLPPPDTGIPAENADMQAILAAWHTATVRLEQTHAALREEVGRLTHELEIKNRELARKNRLADLGQMASHVAHEVRNNLVPVTLYLSLLRRRVVDDPGSLEVVEKIAAGFTAVESTVHDLLHFTSDRDPHWQRFGLRELVDDVRASLAPQLAAQSIEAWLDIPLELTLRADREMIRRAVLNLTLNALDAMPDGGRLRVTAEQTADGVSLTLSDTGPGLSEEALGRAFEPFFTTKRGGTGLGLAIIYRICEAHGGEVRACNGPEGGARFTLRIPHTTTTEAAA